MKSSEAEYWVEHVQSSLDNIVGADQTYCPHVTQREFETKLLPILQEPFNPEAQEAYKKMVHGQRVNIYVVDNRNRDDVIYVIPSLFGDGDYSSRNMNLGNALAKARKEAERNPHLWNRINALLPGVVRDNEGSYASKVIFPILRILHDYNLKMVIPTEEGPYWISYNGTTSTSNEDQQHEDDDDGLDYLD